MRGRRTPPATAAGPDAARRRPRSGTDGRTRSGTSACRASSDSTWRDSSACCSVVKQNLSDLTPYIVVPPSNRKQREEPCRDRGRAFAPRKVDPGPVHEVRTVQPGRRQPYQATEEEPVGATGPGDPLPGGALAHAGGTDSAGATAGGHKRPFRTGTPSLRAAAAPPGPSDGGAADRTVAGHRYRHLEASGDASADRSPGRLPGRESCGAAGRLAEPPAESRLATPERGIGTPTVSAHRSATTISRPSPMPRQACLTQIARGFAPVTRLRRPGQNPGHGRAASRRAIKWRKSATVAWLEGRSGHRCDGIYPGFCFGRL